MSRRGNNTGSVSKRADGRWMGQLIMPDGKRRTVYAKTRSEVYVKIKELSKEADSINFLSPSKNYRNMREFFATWLINVAASVRPRTRTYYEGYIRRYVADLDELAPAQLKPYHIQKLYTKLLEQGLSSTTVRHLHAVLHRALHSGVRQGVFVQNPCDLIDPPRMAVPLYRTFNPQEARQFIEVIKGDRYEALLLLAISTGMRQGELVGLTWDQIDLQRAIIQVTHNIQWIDHVVVMQEPKSATSRRTVYLGPRVCEVLLAHWQRQQETKAELAATWEKRWDLVFRNSTGKALNPGTVLHEHFDPILKRNDLPDIRFHDLRHTAATLLLMAGIHPKVVSEMLGHSSVNITLSLYSHVTPAMHRSASLVMEQILVGENPLEAL